MSYDPNDAAWDNFIDNIYDEFRKSAPIDFKVCQNNIEDYLSTLLSDYYFKHPFLIKEAMEALTEAKK